MIILLKILLIHKKKIFKIKKYKKKKRKNKLQYLGECLHFGKNYKKYKFCDKKRIDRYFFEISLKKKRKKIISCGLRPLQRGGAILYFFENDKKFFLLQKKKNKVEELGGKVDYIDKNIMETLNRKVLEEINKN